jgi:hypothetical protein
MEAMMRRPIWRIAGLVLAAILPAAEGGAQVDDLKGMAGLASSPLSSGSMSNVAGLLQYCIGNGQLSEQGAVPVKNQLMAKLPSGAKTADRGYSDGLKGLLHGSNGNLVDLSGGGGGSTGGHASGSAGMGKSGSMGSIGSGGSTGASTGISTGTSTGTGLSADLTKMACDTVLAQAKSFL